MAQKLNFEYVLCAEGIRENQAIEFDAEGRIIKVVPTEPNLCKKGLVIPGMPNAHSHAFQRALTGFGENQSSKEDSFWSWRENMYALANQLNAEQLYAIALQAYMEMLQAGYTSVAEFHYIHHDIEGRPTFAMADALIQAARDTGIRLRLLPVLYMRGGFSLPAQPEHYRFVVPSLSHYCKLLEHCRKLTPTGIAPHSLRAVPIEHLGKLVKYAGAILGKKFPIHIHIAEQKKEVQDCLAAHKASPVQLLADTVPLTSNWNLVHATHINGREMDLLSRSNAQVILCPLTEAYLGDGVFPTSQFVQVGGDYAIGSDSNVRIDAFEELRFLEYSQRLITRKRARLGNEQGLGQLMWQTAAKTGAKTVQFTVGDIKVGHHADLVVLDTTKAPLNGLPVEKYLDAAVIGGSRDLIKEVYVGGKKIVSENRHGKSADISKKYAQVMQSLRMP